MSLAYRPPEGTVPWHKAATLPTWSDQDNNGDFGYPRNYYIPNFGKDRDVLDVEQSLKEAVKVRGKNFKNNTQWVITEEMVHPKYKEKRDYFVPNFGIDKDILDA